MCAAASQWNAAALMGVAVLRYAGIAKQIPRMGSAIMAARAVCLEAWRRKKESRLCVSNGFC